MWIKDRNVQIGRILMAGCFQLAPWIYSPSSLPWEANLYGLYHYEEFE